MVEVSKVYEETGTTLHERGWSRARL